MALRHIGTDPDTRFNGSPAVWLDQLAVSGAQARRLITAAIGALR